jgi:hypothetical protein
MSLQVHSEEGSYHPSYVIVWREVSHRW